MSIKEEIINKLKELREDVYNHSLNDEINNLVWDNIDDGQYTDNYDKANYIANQLGGIKCSVEIVDQFVGEGVLEWAKPHYSQTISDVECLIQYVEKNI